MRSLEGMIIFRNPAKLGKGRWIVNGGATVKKDFAEAWFIP